MPAASCRSEPPTRVLVHGLLAAEHGGALLSTGVQRQHGKLQPRTEVPAEGNAIEGLAWPPIGEVSSCAMLYWCSRWRLRLRGPRLLSPGQIARTLERRKMRLCSHTAHGHFQACEANVLGWTGAGKRPVTLCIRSFRASGNNAQMACEMSSYGKSAGK